MDEDDSEFRDEDYICVKTWRARHVSGSKDYHVIMIANLSRNAILVMYRWGKAAALGEMQAERFNSTRAAQGAFDKKVREKRFNRGYSHPLPCNLEERKVQVEDLPSYLHMAEISYLENRHPYLFGPTEIDSELPVDIPEEELPAPAINPYANDPEWGSF